MTAVLHHLRRNTIAYVTLFVALGGTGYAAISFVNTFDQRGQVSPLGFDLAVIC